MHPAPKADLRSLFEQALELPPIDRANFLRDLQFKSPILYKQLRSLLFAHEGPSAFFEQDAGSGLRSHPQTSLAAALALIRS